MCGPMQGAVAGIIVYEGWAKDLDEAVELAAGGGVAFHPNHDFGAVGPMTGMTTLSQPLLVVENRSFGNRAYCTINEGLGKVMRFGGNDAEVLGRLAWLRDVFGPALGAAVRETGGIGLKAIVARGLSMGDEMHQRNLACSSIFLREVAPALAAALKSDVCEIYTDVSGVFTTDPRVVPDAQKIDQLSYDAMLELAGAGSAVMQARSIEVAKKFGVKIHVRSSLENKKGTIITKAKKGMEEPAVSGIAYDKNE